MRQATTTHFRTGISRCVFVLAILSIGQVQAEETDMAKLSQKFAELVKQRNYEQAIIFGEQLLLSRETTLGPEHRAVASFMNSLAGLYQDQGRYVLAEPLFKRSLAILEKTLGAEHPDVATGLGNLAELYRDQGQYALAEPLFKRSLAIREKTLGPEHPNVASGLNNLAELYRARGQYALAEPLYKRSLAIREKTLGPEHLNVATGLNNLAELYRDKGQYALAEPLYKRSLEILEKTLGPEHPNVASSLSNLAILYRAQGQYALAEPLYKRSLAIREKTLGPEHPDVAISLNNLAEMYRARGQYALAEPLYKRSMAIWVKTLGPEHPNVAASLGILAELYRDQGQYALAEPLYKRSLAIREKTLGPEHPDVAISLNNLASLYGAQGQYALAEPLYKRSLAIWEKTLGAEHPDVASSLSNLAELYRDQGQYALAEPLFKRSLAIREKTLGPEHPDVAISLNNLANLYQAQGQYALAEPLFKRSLAIWLKTLGPEHPNVATGLSNLASLYGAKGQYALAEPLFKGILAIWGKALGPGHPSVATSLNNLAELYRDQGQYALAEPLFEEILAIWEKTLGPEHPKFARSLNNLAAMYEAQGQYAKALTLARRTSLIYRKRIVAAGADESASREAATGKSALLSHLFFLERNPGNEPSDKIGDEALQIVQLAQASGTASAIAKMAARFASGSDALALLAKRKQDAAEQRSKIEGQLVNASSRSPDKRDAVAEQRLRDKSASIAKELESIDAQLTSRFPAYQELTRPEPLTADKVQRLLKPGEALLVYALGDRSFGWVVTSKGIRFRSLPVKLKDISAQVAKVRSQMEFDATGNSVAVSLDVLHQLYTSLFAPMLPELAGVTHILVVPSGPLQSLPLGMLVAAPPPVIHADVDYRSVEWLAKRYALSVLPAVSSIQAFRQFNKLDRAKEPFAGFGDPDIGDQKTPTRGVRGKLELTTIFRNVAAGGSNAGLGGQGADVADVEAIRRAPRLPETADELRAMAKAMKTSSQTVWLQGEATETRVKSLDLSKFRTLAFATHGVMAGELKGVGEPGLILTPPKTGSIEDDGYLSASEISKLNLNADWVVLSACNTAATDGSLGAEGLSGMAKAFFYAGAQSLLVSHWPVASEATVPLTTVMLQEYQTNPKLGKAQAQRKAMLSLMNTPNHPEYAHPIFWAPFVVVGEGGSDVRDN